MSLRDFISNNDKEVLNKIKNNFSHLKRLKNKTLFHGVFSILVI